MYHVVLYLTSVLNVSLYDILYSMLHIQPLFYSACYIQIERINHQSVTFLICAWFYWKEQRAHWCPQQTGSYRISHRIKHFNLLAHP